MDLETGTIFDRHGYLKIETFIYKSQ